MTTRNRTASRMANSAPNLADLENANDPTEAPGIMPPPGIVAAVHTNVRYQRVITPNESGNYSDELRDLAGSEYDGEELPEPVPQDPYTEFVNTWRKYHGYPLKIVRLPDPADKRMPGHTYNSPCFELTLLSDMPFDANNLIGMLQVINNNSGGVFRVFLTDEIGRPIPGARLDRLVVADPPKQYNQRYNQQSQRQFDPDYDGYDERERYYRRERQTPPTPPETSEGNKRLEQLKDNLFEKLLNRALDPPVQPVPDPLSTLSPDDRLALGLLQRGDILETAVSRIANLAQAPDRIESSTWKDKLADAGLQLVTNNPQIITSATDIISRATVAITSALANAFASRGQTGQQIVNEPIPVTQHAPAQRVPAPRLTPHLAPPLTPQGVNGLPETPQPEDEGLDEEEAEIDMIEEVVKLLLSEKPLSLDDPVVLDISEAYPEAFQRIMLAVASIPSTTLIQIICGKSDFCADLFNSQRNGPYLRQRLEELKTLLKQPINANAETSQTEAPAGEPA